jgi:hypothetical protein
MCLVDSCTTNSILKETKYFLWHPTLKQGWLSQPGSLRVANNEVLTHNTSHTWPKIWIITRILTLHQSTQIMKCSKFKHSRSDTKDGTQRYKGLHRALRCKVLDNSLELRPPADFPVLRWVTTGPHEFATAAAVLGHFCNQKIHKQGLSN